MLSSSDDAGVLDVVTGRVDRCDEESLSMSVDALDKTACSAVSESLPCGQATHVLHVKGIPIEVWMKAKQNAVASDLTWKDYVIRLLADSRSFPRSEASPAHNDDRSRGRCDVGVSCDVGVTGTSQSPAC